MKNISIVKKKVLFSVLVLFIIISVLLNGGCSVNKDTVDTVETDYSNYHRNHSQIH